MATKGPGTAGRVAGTTLLANPQLINEATDFTQGLMDKSGPPPASTGGYAGGLASEIYDKYQRIKNK